MPIEQGYKPNVQRGNGLGFEPLPISTYQVQILDVKVKKDQVKFKKDPSAPDVLEDQYAFTFIIVEEGEFLRRRLWKDCRQIMNPAFDGGSSSSLYDIFSAAKKVMLTKDEADSITPSDINSLIGLQLQLIVKQKPVKDGSYKNVIESYMPAKAVIPFDPTKRFERKDGKKEDNSFAKELEDEAAVNNVPPATDEESIDVDEIPFN